MYHHAQKVYEAGKDLELHPSQRSVLLWLAHNADEHGEIDEENDTLVWETGLTRSSTTKAKQALKEMGFVEHEPRDTYYKLNLEAL